MLKKLNNYLLVNFPLLWNTRIIQVLSFMAVCHIVFFILGYNSLYTLRALYDYRFKFLDNFEVNLIAALIIAIVFIVWLVFYLRNNLFKSFYPVTKWYLVKEFFIVLTIVFLTLPLYNSFAYGKHLKILKLGKNTNPEMDMQIVNQARCFLPTSLDSYEKNQCCDTVDAKAIRDSIKDAKYSKLNENRCNGYLSEETPQRLENILDSLPNKEYSYLYYCLNNNVANYVLFNKNNKRWLLNKQKDSIQLAINKLLKIADIYKIKHKIKSNRLTDWCFANSKFEPYNLITTGNYGEAYTTPSMYNEEEDIKYVNSDYYFELDNLYRGIEKVEQEQAKGFFDQVNWLIYIYISLGIAIVLFMFRVTRLKQWLIAIVGLGIVGIIFAIIAQMSRSTDFMLYFYFLFIISIALISILWIKNDKSKMITGVVLNWFAYLMGSFLITLAGIIIVNTKEIRKCINNYWVVIRPEPPIHKWLNDNMATNVQYINIVFILLMMVFVIIPLAYKWQANKAE